MVRSPDTMSVTVSFTDRPILGSFSASFSKYDQPNLSFIATTHAPTTPENPGWPVVTWPFQRGSSKSAQRWGHGTFLGLKISVTKRSAPAWYVASSESARSVGGSAPKSGGAYTASAFILVSAG